MADTQHPPEAQNPHDEPTAHEDPAAHEDPHQGAENAMTTIMQSALYPADNPAVTAHINMLQGIINRLANNSSSCKTWCLVLVTAFLSLTGATHLAAIATLALMPVAIFGFVDTMYLAQEKAYRDLYDTVVATVRDGSYRREDAFNAKAARGFGHVVCALTSWSIWPIYGGLIAAYFVAQDRGWLALLATPPRP
jgi:hypothetical protein